MGGSTFSAINAGFPPCPSNDFFEWTAIINVLLSSRASVEPFTFVDGGAGIGIWAVNLANTAERIPNFKPNIFTFSVEADPAKLKDLKSNLDLNKLSAGNHHVLQFGMSGKKGKHFIEANNTKYGSRIIPIPKSLDKFDTDSFVSTRGDTFSVINCIDLLEIVTLVEEKTNARHISLINLDIQGSELSFIEEHLEVLTETVESIHVATHHPVSERRLYEMLIGAGWRCHWFYKRKSINETPYGYCNFDDGSIFATNPKLKRYPI